MRLASFKHVREIILVVLFALSTGIFAAESKESQEMLITNINIFNGKDNRLLQGQQVLVRDNLIVGVGKNLKTSEDVMTIDGGGGTLMPGLIDMHAHLAYPWYEDQKEWDAYAVGAVSVQNARHFLDQGFTTVRSVGGPDLGLAKLLQKGLIPGPRLYPAGPFISQTGGHGHAGDWADPLGFKDLKQLREHTHVVDGTAEVLEAVRHNLRRGATHIKVMAGGGISSEFDPLHVTQYSEEEMRAAVEAAKDWGTYVTVHAYNDRAVNRAIDAGVKCIEHGGLLSEKTLKRMAKEGVVLSFQATIGYGATLDPADMPPYLSDNQKKKMAQLGENYPKMAKWARKHNVFIVAGGDIFGSEKHIKRNLLSVLLEPMFGFSPYEALLHHTGNAGKMLKGMGLMTPDLDPYPAGKLGVVEAGAYADVLIVDGNPLEDLNTLKNLKVIIKDGKLVKNAL